MAKEVELKVRIDTGGRLHVEPEGTQGEECVELMEFLESIPGLTITSKGRVDTDDPNDGQVHLKSST